MEEVLGQEMEKKLQGDRKFTKQVKSGRILLEKKRCVPKFEHNASKEWGYIHESRSKNYTLSSLSAWPPAGRCRGCKPAETGPLQADHAQMFLKCPKCGQQIGISLGKTR